jgi:uncharacterized protein (DUF362 family)
LSIRNEVRADLSTEKRAATPPETAIDRRQALLSLLRLGGLTAAAGGLVGWLHMRSVRPEPEQAAATSLTRRTFTVAADPALPEMAVVQGEDPRALARGVFEELGGVRRFISRGDVVVIKPNIGWDRTPEQAATTNPELVAEVVHLCLDAGATRVVVTDVSCNEPRRCFARSGIAEAAQGAGARVVLPDERLFRNADLRGDVLHVWPILQPFLEADKVINMPIAKQHSLTGCTLGMKNWYGILGGQRSRLHQNINESLADLASFMRPTLTILDCYRVLLRNGPTGGNLEDVALKKTVVASTDAVALDAYAAKAYWELDVKSLPYLKLAADRGLGRLDFEQLRTRVVTR